MSKFEKVPGTRSVELLPSSRGENPKHGSMEFEIATLPPIRQHLRDIAGQAYARAWGVLGAIRASARSFGDVTEWVDLSIETNRVDSYLILTDTKNGQKGAMSIEYGRDEYEVESKDGSTHTVGAMTGKGILHRAFNMTLGSLRGTGGGDIP